MNEVVKYRTVSITVYPWTKSNGSEYWQFRYVDPSSGKQMRVTRSTLAKAKLEALKHAQATYRGRIDLDLLTIDQTAGIQRMLAVDPNLSMVDEFLVWHSKRKPTKNSKEAVNEFIASKTANRGKSHYNVANLKRHLKHLPDANLCDISPGDLPVIAGAARTRRNAINAWVTFFRWCVRQEYLPYGQPTAPERLDKPIISRGIPSTYDPAEIQTLVSNVEQQYLPWLVLGAFAGFRTEEVCPDPKSGKSGLTWEDIQWDRDLIIVRPETSKTGHRRVVPLLPVLKAILSPHKGVGPIGPHLPPHTPQKGGKQSETTRLGESIGGWKRNALRHSFISYRAAIVGLSQTAMEAGNSEAEARRSYNDAKGADEAVEWFAIRP